MEDTADRRPAADSPKDRVFHFAGPGALQGLALWQLFEAIERSEGFAPLVSLLLFLVVVPPAYFVTTAEGGRARAAVFAVGLGTVLAGLLWLTQASRPDWAFEDGNPWVFGLGFVGAGLVSWIAVPFARTLIERRPSWTHYPSLFEFSWNLPVVLFIAGAFTGGVWAILGLLGGLFAIIGIDLLYDLYAEPVFSAPLTTAAFALGIGVVRDREGVVLALRGILLALLRVVAPIFALGLAVFTVALVIKGFDAIWDGWSPTVTLSVTVATAIVFFNALIESHRPSRWRDLSAGALAVTAFALALASGWGVWLRIAAEGLTPSRIVAIVPVVALVLYGAFYTLALVAGRRWDWARRANVLMALLVAGVTLFLQSTAFQPERWSVASQEALIRDSGELGSEDIRFLAFDSGMPGRILLGELRDDPSFRPDDEDLDARIDDALTVTSRWLISDDGRDPGDFDADVATGAIIVQPSRTEVPNQVRRLVLRNAYDISPDSPLVLFAVPDAQGTRWFMLKAWGSQARIEMLSSGTDDPYVVWTGFEAFDSAEDARAYVIAAAEEPLAIVEIAVEVPRAGGVVFTPRGFGLGADEDGENGFRVIDPGVPAIEPAQPDPSR